MKYDYERVDCKCNTNWTVRVQGPNGCNGTMNHDNNGLIPASKVSWKVAPLHACCILDGNGTLKLKLLAPVVETGFEITSLVNSSAL